MNCCIYFLIKDKKVVYIGQTTNFPVRITAHYYDSSKDFDSVRIIKCERHLLLHYEKRWIAIFKPSLNGFVGSRKQNSNNELVRITLPLEVYNGIKKQAEKSFRSLNNHIVFGYKFFRVWLKNKVLLSKNITVLQFLLDWGLARFSGSCGFYLKKHMNKQVLLIALLFLITSCAPDHVDVTSCVSGKADGFWFGLWHGFISPITFFISLFSDSVAVYSINNNGGWYNFGFLVGAGVLLGGGTASRK